jgi:hypothetical protein
VKNGKKKKNVPIVLREEGSPYRVEPENKTQSLRFIDLFCGIGGFRIAFEKAGCKCVFSSDWDKFSQQTYAANFGEKPHGDIHSIAVADIPKFDILCGGWLFLSRTQDGQLFGLIFQRDSAWLRAAQALFGVQDSTPSFDTLGQEKLHNQSLELLRRQILFELGLDVVLPVLQTDEELMISKFGRTFPKTKEMSAFARSQVQTDSNRVDETLVRWLDREEELFLALERVIIRERLKSVVPQSLHATYTSGQLKEMLNLAQFIEIVRHNQSA